MMIVSANCNRYEDAVDYLRIDDYLADVVTARALYHAFELHWLDTMADTVEPVDLHSLIQSVHCDATGLAFTLDLLEAGCVIERVDTGYRLTSAFREAWRYRDLLEAKLEFTLLAASDYLEQFASLVQSEAAYYERSRILELFDYSRCLETDADARASAWRWMRFTTALTKYETPALLERYDVRPFRRMLDVGGNSGEFARQWCSRNERLQATILDLPAVCAVGRDYVSAFPESNRVSFAAGSALESDWPDAPDLITFKSMLHDWPEEGVRVLLRRAVEHLPPNGTLLIFERDALRLKSRPPRFSDLANLIFFRSFRGPSLYREILEEAGLNVHLSTIMLETPFLVLTARRPD